MFNMKSNTWQPICDTMKHVSVLYSLKNFPSDPILYFPLQTQSVSNNFFIIDIIESSQILQAVLCRGASYPMTNPRPMVTELPMQIPLCELDSDKSQLEETLIRYSTFNVDNSELVVKETATKLFAVSSFVGML